MKTLLAAALVGTGILGVGLVHSTADASTKMYRPATLAYYANVDAEGDLGSHYGAAQVTVLSNQQIYDVRFTANITHCAAVAQPGKAGGSDPVKQAESLVVNSGKHSFLAEFLDPNGTAIAEPFMMTVTCTR